MNYEGSDPIEPWVEYICFLEQHRLNENTKFSFKYKHAILQCIKTFMMMPVYQNDKRLVEIYLKSVREKFIRFLFIKHVINVDADLRALIRKKDLFAEKCYEPWNRQDSGQDVFESS